MAASCNYAGLTEAILTEINRHALLRRNGDLRWVCRCGEVYEVTEDRDISPTGRQHLAEALARVLGDQ